MEERKELIAEITEILNEVSDTNPLNSFYLTGELVHLTKQLQKIDLQLSKQL